MTTALDLLPTPSALWMAWTSLGHPWFLPLLWILFRLVYCRRLLWRLIPWLLHLPLIYQILPDRPWTPARAEAWTQLWMSLESQQRLLIPSDSWDLFAQWHQDPSHHPWTWLQQAWWLLCSIRQLEAWTFLPLLWWNHVPNILSRCTTHTLKTPLWHTVKLQRELEQLKLRHQPHPSPLKYPELQSALSPKETTLEPQVSVSRTSETLEPEVDLVRDQDKTPTPTTLSPNPLPSPNPNSSTRRRKGWRTRADSHTLNLGEVTSGSCQTTLRDKVWMLTNFSALTPAQLAQNPASLTMDLEQYSIILRLVASYEATLEYNEDSTTGSSDTWLEHLNDRPTLLLTPEPSSHNPSLLLNRLALLNASPLWTCFMLQLATPPATEQPWRLPGQRALQLMRFTVHSCLVSFMARIGLEVLAYYLCVVWLPTWFAEWANGVVW